MHPGGIVHAAIHGLGTFIVMAFYDIKIALIAALFDCLVHYHIDWAKMKSLRYLIAWCIIILIGQK